MTSYGDATYWVYYVTPDGQNHFPEEYKNIRKYKTACNFYFDVKRSTPEGTDIRLVRQRMEYTRMPPEGSENREKLRKRKKSE